MGAIVVGMDGSSHALAALRWALDEAALRGARVRLVHVWQPALLGGYPYTEASFDPEAMEAEAKLQLDRAVGEVTVPPGVEIEPVIVCGSPAEALIQQSAGADMVVVGSRGRGGFAELVLGSVSHQVAQHAPCPVVIVRA